MFVVAVIVFPVLLLLLLLAMEQVERPLRDDQVSVEVARFLDSPSLDLAPEDLEMFASREFAPRLDRYWRRHRPAAGGQIEDVSFE